MCNYYGHRVNRAEFIRLKGIEKQFGRLAALATLKSGFAYGDMEVLKPNYDKTDFDPVLMHWEYVPGFVKDMEELKLYRKGINPKTGIQGTPIPWLNAKGENLFVNDRGARSMWADAARSSRCVVPMGHFFEWRHYKPEGEKKDIAYPYLIEKADQDYLYAAGIWNTWTDKSSGETMDTFAIVTTKANELMSQIHNKKLRQPTFLTEDMAYDWMLKSLTNDEITKMATTQMPSEEMNAYTIIKDFRTAPNPLEPFEYEELPPIDIDV